MATIRKSLAISFAEKYSALILNFIGTLILARILTPEDIGIFSVGVVIIGLAQTLRDFGVSNYLIQEKELTKEKIRTAFTFTFIFAWGLALALFLLSPFISAFYNEPGIEQVIQVLCINFLLIPLSSISVALFRRDMDFASLYKINVFSTIIQNSVAVYLAVQGFGFMSLAWGGLAGVLATTLAAAYLSKNIGVWKPSFKERHRVFSFGSKSSVTSLITELGIGAPDLIIGKALGFEALGYFSRAIGTVTIFNKAVMDAIRPVALPYFASKHRENYGLKSLYITAIDNMLVVAWPFLAFIGIMAYPIVRTLYGDQWDAAVPIIQILCIPFAIRCIQSISASVLTSTGAIHRTMIAQIILESTKIILILLLVGYGLTMVAWSLAIAELIGFIVYTIMLKKTIAFNFIDYLHPVKHALIVTVFASAAPLGVTFFLNDILDNLVLCFLLSIVGATFGWIVSLIILYHPMWSEMLKIYDAFIAKQ